MKNRPPNVFISSTMYDLRELRVQIGQFVESLGWHAVMSEYDSFPIDPGQTTVENSRRNVRENADIFVMVVGARYGSIDARTDKSVTNLEFVEAQGRGMPAYVFVSGDLLAQSRIWEASPDVDYSSVVDTPRVFEFIESFRAGGATWTFGFSTAQDIVRTLRQQFAYLAQDAIALRQMARGQDQLLQELEGDALMLALQRDVNWEVKLFATVLEAELDRRATLRSEIEHRLASDHPTVFVDIFELASWMEDRMAEFRRLVDTASAILNDYLPRAREEDEARKRAREVAAVARRLAQVWEDAAQWTLRCRSVRVDGRAQRLIDLLSDVNANILDEIWEYGHSALTRIEEALSAPDDGEPVPLDLTLTLTADVEDLSEELDRLTASLF